MKNKVTIAEVRKMAEALGFKYRASGENPDNPAAPDKAWITFTYPGTNSHVVYIDVAGTGNIMKKLGDELVRCGRIQQRQNFLREFSPFNYE